MLFDDIPRTDASPRGQDEALYAFLNRVAGDDWEGVRHVLSEWHRHYPKDDQYVLRRRFQSADRRGLLGAFWELYLHELFRRLDFTIELHPLVAAATHRPDFRLQRDGEAIYVEAATMYEPQANVNDDPRLAPVLDVINSITSRDFDVSVDARQIAAVTPSIKRLSRELQGWLDSLDIESESGSTRTADHVFRWEERGWMLIFRPVPRRASVQEAPSRQSSAPASMNPMNARANDDPRIIRQRLGGKTRVYGRSFGDPFVIAMLSFRSTTGPEEVLRALFGSAADDPAMMLEGRIRGPWPNGANGFWLTKSGVQYQDVSGIITAFQMLPWSMTRALPWFIPNPWAHYPLNAELPLNRFDIDESTGEIRAMNTGLSPHLLFDLPRNSLTAEEFSRHVTGG